MANFDWFQQLVKKDPAAVKKWVDATYRNRSAQAMGPLAGNPVAAGMAQALSDLNLNLQGQAFQHTIDFENEKKRQRDQMVAQFAAGDKNIAAERTASNKSLADYAKQLGIQQALNDPSVGANNRELNRLQLTNTNNRTNQLASLDFLGNSYDDLLTNRAHGYDASAAANLSGLYDAIIAATPKPSSGGGGGGGGRRRGSGSGTKSTPADAGFAKTQVSQYVIDPSNPPRESTYGTGYVKPDVAKPHWVVPHKIKIPPTSRFRQF